ncbi:hypothetical protein ACX13_09745 [Vibrio parahaemolyticus]|nr:hypothetical protein ACX13_09745 [Vibrio parahaemolyticus]ODW78144.1 hypothetical protein BBM89_20750 [Vibrio parahaemolyticus]
MVRPWFFQSAPLGNTGLRVSSHRSLLDLLGFPCAQIRHAMNHIWTMGEILRRVKGVYWSEKSFDNKEGGNELSF